MPATQTRAPRRAAKPAPVQTYRITLASFQKRGAILMMITAVVLSLFAGRLVELQAVRGEALASAALNQRLTTEDLPAERGAIVDSRGEPFAITVEARNITADQTLVTDPAVVAAALAPIVNQDVVTLQERLTGTRRFVYVAKDITPETWRRIQELRLPGILSEQTSRRVYPAGPVAANIVGFVGADGTPLGGLEYGMNDLLSGEVGTRTFERGPGGRVIPTASSTRTDPKPGATVHLTINRDIQHVAQQAISEQVKAARADSGTVVVMDPKTGDILAMATAPTFDANNPGAADVRNRGNRALTEIFEPGSTGKVMTLAAVVDQGKATPYSQITVPGKLPRGGKDFKDHTPHGTLRMTLAGIMAKSSNIGTILAAERIGGKRLHRYLKRFGVGEATGLNFPGEARGFVPAHRDWTATSLPTISFGQGLSMNAVQATNVYATIANDGVRLPPRLVSHLTVADGSIEPVPIAEGRKVVSPKAAEQVRAMIETVVRDGGTGTAAAIPGYRVGGKTGTAQYIDPVRGGYGRGVMASFIGMAPIDAPELVVGVFVVNPRIGRYGGQLGGPVFKRVMTYALQAQRVPPTGTKAPRLPLFAGE
jgi:cell division protein FtsI (penicillin-binding protein 3)